jgi:micrococcal nuclease
VRALRRPLRRRWWRGPALGAVLAAAALAGGAGRAGPPEDGSGRPERAGERLRAEVVEVTDGDTVVVRLDDGTRESVRYIGIDTPESDPREPLECFGLRAKRANARLVAGRRVTLLVGAEPRDAYGRLLAFVRAPLSSGAGTLLVNAELVRRGYARTLTIAPNDALAPALRRLESAAGRRGRGLWGRCGT